MIFSCYSYEPALWKAMPVISASTIMLMPPQVDKVITEAAAITSSCITTAAPVDISTLASSWTQNFPATGKDFALTLLTTVQEATPRSLKQLQELGENAFAAMFVIAFIQAMIALFQYRNNPKGSLLVPPGLREGNVSPGAKCEECEYDEDSWYFALKDLESSFQEMRSQGMMESMMPTFKGEPSDLVKRINKALILLVPWASNVFSFIVQRNIHLCHLGFFLSLSQLLDVPDRLFSNNKQQQSYEMQVNMSTLLPFKDNKEDKTTSTLSFTNASPIQRVVVIGDSLAAGVGTVDIFEEELISKGESKPTNGPGPVFPRVLAQRISENTASPVRWRSSGIVGGDAQDVYEGCLDIVREEVEAGRPPDVVLIICGINDLKKFATKPWKNVGPKEFRQRMTRLVQTIRDLSPGTKVVMPSIPTQMFRRDSPLNIFPLVFFLNTVVGFWDAQKKMVAKQFPMGEVAYIGLDPDEVYDWYMTDPSQYGVPSDLDGDGIDDTTLISRDGVHPNARCYAFWGASLGEKLSRMWQRENSDASVSSSEASSDPQQGPENPATASA